MFDIQGTYLEQNSLTKPVPEIGDAPCIHVNLSFFTEKKQLAGSVSMWGLVDSGADELVMPGWAMGLEMNGDKLKFLEGSIGSKLNYRRVNVSGVTGERVLPCVAGTIELNGQSVDDGEYDVIIAPHRRYPLIGRAVLNKFRFTILNPADRRLVLAKRKWEISFRSPFTALKKLTSL